MVRKNKDLFFNSRKIEGCRCSCWHSDSVLLLRTKSVEWDIISVLVLDRVILCKFLTSFPHIDPFNLNKTPHDMCRFSNLFLLQYFLFLFINLSSTQNFRISTSLSLSFSSPFSLPCTKDFVCPKPKIHHYCRLKPSQIFSSTSFRNFYTEPSNVDWVLRSG